MAKKLTSKEILVQKLKAIQDKIPSKYQAILLQFCSGYLEAAPEALPSLLTFLKLIEEQFLHPYTFAPYHQKITHPIDYHRFALDFIRPLIDLPHSRLIGKPHFDEVERLLQQGENAIFLANHQAELDPLAITLLLEPSHPDLARRIIYVAGERVLTDPLAIPFSMGCTLLCIYSKRYIDHPPHLKAQKQLHNKHTMEKMSRLLEEGGHAIYIAPSGGRDRKGASGQVEVAPFDPQSLEMLFLMAKRAKTPTHFYPMTLDTYDLLPPPETIQRELGEERIIRRSSSQLALDAEFDMEHFPGSDALDKQARRQNRAHAAWTIVKERYASMKQRDG